jgi:hypothetical protein
LPFGVDLGYLVVDERAKQHDAAVGGGGHDHGQSGALDRFPRCCQNEIGGAGLGLPIVQGIEIVGIDVEQRDRPVDVSYPAPDNSSRSARFLFSLFSAFKMCPARLYVGGESR